MRRNSLDKIKNSIQFAYDRYRVFQIKRSAEMYYNRFLKSYGKIKRPDPTEYIKYWKRLSNFVDPTGFHIHYTLHGFKDIQMVPNAVYKAFIEPCLNDYTMSKVYQDKNSYDRLLNRDFLPKTYLRNMAGVYYDREYKLLNDQQVRDILKALPKKINKVILKPTLVTGGRNKVRFVDFNLEIITKEYLQENYHQNFIIEEFIEQNEYFDQLGTTCSMRFNTYRSVSDNSIFVHEMNCSFNSGIGPDRSQYINNTIAINESGKIGSISLTPLRQVCSATPDGTKSFSEMKPIPEFNELRKVAAITALSYPYHRRLGFDMIVDKKGKVYIFEVNVGRLGFNISQYLGGGLFKEYTEEVIKYCNNNKSKIHFPFTQ
ncbi:sugar-transfer associated ATP-grasp domain-containing protein [Candidatus Neomarinimicrobiota bacterium]